MRRALVVLALTGSFAARSARGDAATDDQRARQLASLLGLESELDRLVKSPPPVTVQESIAHLGAIEDAIVMLSRASLDLDAMRAQLLHEQYEAKTAHDIIQKRHEDSVQRWSIAAVIVGSVGAVVGNGLEIGGRTAELWGDGVAITGSVAATAFSIVALSKHNVGPLHASIETNLLGPLFDCPPAAHSGYPAWLWRYLDTPLAGSSRSIRQQLLEKWAREGRIPAGELRPDDVRVRHLCQPMRAANRIDADLLDDRADMLADVRERIAGLSVDFELLWRQLRAQR